MIEEPWYADLAARYGEAFAREAGYFDETRPFRVPYAEVFELPKGKTVLQFSGAFHPLHEGHLETIRRALAAIDAEDMLVLVHVDHVEYRASKGACAEAHLRDGLRLLQRLDVPWMVLREDEMPDGCSRNFTRLYAELARHNTVWFLAGGDRANYALTFRHRGACLVAGRERSPMWRAHHHLHDGTRIIFLGGDNPISSTEIRRRLAGTTP